GILVMGQAQESVVPKPTRRMLIIDDEDYAGNSRSPPGHRSAVHRYRHAGRHDGLRTRARGRNATPRAQSSADFRLYRARGYQWLSRYRRAGTIEQAVPQARSCGEAQKTARSDGLAAIRRHPRRSRGHAVAWGVSGVEIAERHRH